MNIAETSQVLAKIKLGDNREINELVIKDWHDVISPLPYQDAIEAVRMHRAESLDYLMPAHIYRNCKRIAAVRIEAENVKALSDHKVGNSKPLNYDAMVAAHNDPIAWAREVGIYHQQLRDAGEEF